MANEVLTQPFPLYESGSKQYKLGNQASGATNAIAKVVIELNNFPARWWGIRITNVVELPANALIDFPERISALYQSDLLDQVSVEIKLTQQNITADGILQRNLTGQSGIVWSGFPDPYDLKGTNNLTVELTRLTPLPDFDTDVPLLPTAHVSLLMSSQVSDLLSGAGSASTGAASRAARRG